MCRIQGGESGSEDFLQQVAVDDDIDLLRLDWLHQQKDEE